MSRTKMQAQNYLLLKDSIGFSWQDSWVKFQRVDGKIEIDSVNASGNIQLSKSQIKTLVEWLTYRENEI